jgi:DNA replication protein DnaC
MSIKQNAQSLLLSYISQNYIRHLNEANGAAMPYDEFLDGLLSCELEHRKENRLKKRMAAAKFPYKKYFVDFNLDGFEKKTAAIIRSFQSLEFVRANENIILIGNPGVGKTHLAIALGIEACIKDMRVLYANVPNLVTELREAMSLNQLGVYRRKFEKYDLVILDELGYVSFDKNENELLFNLISNRNSSGSIIVTTNLVFERWNEIFKDTVLAGAIVDRIAHKSYVLDLSGESFRAKETKDWFMRKLDHFSTV